MLQALGDPILPIFAVVLAGMVLRRTGAFGTEQAAAVNRFVFFFAAPPLVFAIMVNAPYGALNWPVLVIYVGTELVLYAVVAVVARRIFARPLAESLLLGMTAIFSNHVFFVRPIAVLLFGEAAVSPIAAIILLDTLAFCGTVLAIDLIASGQRNVAGALGALARNPFVYAPLLAWAYLGLGDWAPAGIMTFARFAGDAASPASLFALGVVLAGLQLNRIEALVGLVVAVKLLAHPLIVYLGVTATAATGNWATLPVLVAAGPCGAMPFVIATQYDVRSDLIAKAVLISTVLSTLTLSILVQNV